jgi:putative acetyltransferase
MKTMRVSIRREQPGDERGIRETNERAFGTALEARLVDALRGTAGSISLVATLGDAVVGHILFTEVTIEPAAAARVAGLGPMAVRPEYQRSGIGAQLVRTGLDECRRAGFEAIVVLGHPEYYPRFGFVPAATKGLVCEFPAPPEAFMILELEARASRGIPGLVRYRPEFAAFDKDDDTHSGAQTYDFGAAMAHVISFRTARFDTSMETPNPINPIAGQSILNWLREELANAGYRCSHPDAEDWGWYIDVEGHGATYLVGASADAEGEAGDRDWTIQVHKNRSFREKLLGGNRMTTDDPLSALIERLVRADSQHQQVSVDKEE